MPFSKRKNTRSVEIRDPYHYKKKIIACFIVRNGDKYLKTNINKIIQYFYIHSIDWMIVYVENDSTDNTRAILLEFETKYKNRFIGRKLNLNNSYSTELCENDIYNCPKRTILLGTLRQKSLDICYKYKSDIILMLDMDFISFDYDKLFKMFTLFEEYKADAIFGMSKNKNGDIYDWGAVIPRTTLEDIKNHRNNIIKVKSAFSGFGIYRTDSIKKYYARYDIKFPDELVNITKDSGQIEHIPFNLHFKLVFVYPFFNPIY